MKSEKISDVALVGGGFSGAAVVYHLLKDAKTPLAISVFEPRAQVGLGIAYGDCSQRQILNVRSKGMSIDESRPDHYSKWLESSGIANAADLFSERYRYGQYVSLSLSSVATTSGFEHIKDSVVAITKNQNQQFEIFTQDGKKFLANSVVLALGVVLANAKKEKGPTAHLTSPWKPGSFSKIKDASNLLIVGTGLTAIDVIVEAEYSGFKGKYTVVSRHAKFPQPHLDNPKSASAELLAWANSLRNYKPSVRALLRSIRSKVRSGVSWYEVIDALRIPTQDLWKGLSARDKHSFLRHLRWAWDIHRHQAPGQSIKLIESLISSGRMTLVKGRIKNITIFEGRTSVYIQPRGAGQERTIEADIAFDGMGMGTDIKRSDNPLILQMLKDGLITVDDLGIGLRADDLGRVISQHGQISDNLFLLGPLRRGELWESTAARELRAQGRVIAQEILSGVQEQVISQVAGNR
jgi:uncharacterized NAD(P)/FAD-binding protein YdhS